METKTNATQRTPGTLSRNISPARKYATLFAGRNTHVCVLDTLGKTDAEIEANADYIVAAWNEYEALRASHDALVAALRDLLSAYGNCGSPRQQEAADAARDALSAAKAVQS